jgi:hypothetical protein
MLLRSGENLEYGAIDFLKKSESVTLYSAYLKVDELKRINEQKKIKQIIVRWEIEDLCRKISDIELFQYCKENNIVLYRNTRIHLKAFWNNKSDVLFGSANITNKGLGENGNFNFELNGTIKGISFADQTYFNKLILDSEYVTDALYEKLFSLIENTLLPIFDFPKLPTPPPTVDYFLINQLPMTTSPELLFEIYSGQVKDELEMNCAAHDLELYHIPKGLTKSIFFDQLRQTFNGHSFIIDFKFAIKNSVDEYNREDRNGSMTFGRVKRWFQENTTTVPTPRSFELNDYVNILYAWICYFDECYSQGIPGGHSQVIKYIAK